MAYEGWKKTAAAMTGIFAGLVEAPVRQVFYVLDSVSRVVQAIFSIIVAEIAGNMNIEIFTLFPREYEICKDIFKPFSEHMCPDKHSCSDIEEGVVSALTRHFCPGTLRIRGEYGINIVPIVILEFVSIPMAPISMLFNIFHRGGIETARAYEALSGLGGGTSPTQPKDAATLNSQQPPSAPESRRAQVSASLAVTECGDGMTRE